MMKKAVNLAELFKEKGYKYTMQRKKILDILMEKSSKHLKANDICELVKAKYPDIGMATVYRALLIFDELQIINKLGSGDEFNRYEYNANDDAYEHHHLICMKCGEIKDTKESIMNVITEKVLNQYNFTTKGHNQKLYGTCTDCLVKERGAKDVENIVKD